MPVAARKTLQHMLPVAAVLFFCGISVFGYSGNVAFVIPSIALCYLLLVAYNFKAAYIIMLVLIPLSRHVELSDNTLSLSLPEEPIMWVFYIITLLLLLYKKSPLPGWFIKNSITVCILAQLLWLIVTVIYSQEPLLSVKYLLSKTWYLVCFYLVPVWIIRDKKDVTHVFMALLLPILLTIIIILFNHSAYDFKFYFIDAAVGDWYYKHVDYASVISMFFPFTFIAIFLINKDKKWLKYSAIFISLIFVLAIALSYTRAAMGAITFAGIVALAIKYRLANYIIPTFYVAVLALFIFLTKDNYFLRHTPDFNQTYMHHEFDEHLEATLKGKDMSSMERLYRWIAAIRMAQENPVTGYGPHAFYYHYKPYTIPAYRTYVSENYEKSTTHNYYLHLLAEQGIPGMLLYAIFVVLVIAKAQQIYHKHSDRCYKLITLASAMSFSVFFVNNLFSELLETDKIAPLVYLSLSVLVIIDSKTKEQPESIN